MILYSFKADWCGPCKLYGPTVDKVSKELNIPLTIINIDETDSDAVVKEYSIRSIPSLVLKKDDGTVHPIIGSKTEEELKTELSKLLS